MNEFVASNGVKVWNTLHDQSAALPIDYRRAKWDQTKEDEIDALREFFRAEEDERLGRWRSKIDPTWTAIDGLKDYVVFRNDDGLRGFSMHRETRNLDAWNLELQAIGREYSSAHPEPKKPWEDAQEGDVWIVTPSKALTLGQKVEYPAFFQADRFRDHGGSWDMHDITDARLIYRKGDTE